MLVDSGDNIAKLASSIPAMEYLEQIMSHIWYHLHETEAHYFKHDGKLFFIGTKTNKSEENIDINLLLRDAETNCVVEVKNKLEFTRKILEGNINSWIEGEGGHKAAIPGHLQSFVKYQLKKWIDSAIMASFYYHENINYLVVQKKTGRHYIAPVDYSNTGIVQEKVEWQNGLHQFLQLKHGLKLKAESLTTSFISNMGYFKKYAKNIFGLTGTLGSKDSIELLEEIYSVKTIVIPPYKHSKLVILTHELVHGESDWKFRIANSVIAESMKGRSSLVICETIYSLELIKSTILSFGFNAQNLLCYSRNDNDEVLSINKVIGTGMIILGTNLAARGTDFKTSKELEDRGGIHVCITYCPSNKRVQDQPIGRTARQGNNGTAQMILDIDASLAK